MLYFLLGFFVMIALHIAYIVVLFFNKAKGHDPIIALYGWTIFSDFRRLKHNLSVTGHNWVYILIMLLFFIGLLGSVLSMWYGIHVE